MWERLSTESEDEGGARQVRRPTARRGPSVRLAAEAAEKATMLPEFRFRLSVVGARSGIAKRRRRKSKTVGL